MSVEFFNESDVSEHKWCNSAIMFRVSNGIGTITHKSGAKNCEDYSYYSYLTLNDKPILQEYRPFCDTCMGMLATGYGIENIDCPELKAVRECLNSDYKDIKTSAEMLKPLLNLLEDGYYLLADVPHYPTDSNDTFFWSVPNKMKYNEAFRDGYYNEDFRCQIQGFPQYLYPTQSADMCNEKRVNEYVEIFKNNPNPPRAFAYHEYGFISALLDGHHKATAAAILGKKINCLTIISISGYYFDSDNDRLKSIIFRGIYVPVPAGSRSSEYRPRHEKTAEDVKFTEYNLTGRSFPEAEKNASLIYPDIKAVADIYLANLENPEFTDEIIDDLIAKEDFYKLKYLLAYLMVRDKDMAYRTAVKIVKEDHLYLPCEKAWRVLLQFRDEQTEQLFINHIVTYGNKSAYYDIITSYWD